MAMAVPIIPQTKITFVGSPRPRVLPSIGETVAVLITHDWGPLGSELDSPEVIVSFDEFTERYGDSDTSGRTAVAEAFIGQGTPGAGGAGAVIPFRMATEDADRATKTIQNTAGTPADAIVLTARWAGARGNDYTYSIDTDPADNTRHRFRLKFRGVVVETHVYVKAEVAALVDAINRANLGHITAALLVTGTALATGTDVALTGGDDGDVLTSDEYLAALAGLEFQPFTILAGQNLTDSGVQASVLSWIQTQDEENRPVVWVVGGDDDETLDDAISRTDALADIHVVNFGVGTYHDDVLDKDLSTAQLAPRIAGCLAALGKKSALTAAELGGLHIVGGTGISTEDAKVAAQRGVTVAIRTESPDADIRIARGLTTFTDTTDVAHPLSVFSEPRFIRVMDLFVRDMKLWGDRVVIGKLPVNQDTRDAVKQYANTLIDMLVRDGLILTKAGGAEQDPYVVVPVTTDDKVPFAFGWQFAYTTNFLLGEGTVR